MGKRIAVEKIPYRRLTHLGSRVVSRIDFKPVENQVNSSSFTSHGIIRTYAVRRESGEPSTRLSARTPWTEADAVDDLTVRQNLPSPHAKSPVHPRTQALKEHWFHIGSFMGNHSI